jgi:hypothetical protein
VASLDLHAFQRFLDAAIPIRPELEMLRDPDCKKPKLSLRIPTLKDMSSSYRIGASASRRRDEDFLCPAARHPARNSALHALLGNEKPSSTRCPDGSIYLSRGGSIYLSGIV